MSDYRALYARGYRPPSGYRVGAYGNDLLSTPTLQVAPTFWLAGWNADGLGTNNSGVADGAATGTWVNTGSTGASVNPTQPTGSKQPLLKTGANGINGVSVLRFDGVDDWMFNPIDIQGANTSFLVFRLTSTPGASTFFTPVIYKGSTGSLFDELLLVNNAGYQPYSIRSDYQSAGNGVGIANALDTLPHILATSYNAADNSTVGSYTIALDGAVKTVVASAALAMLSTAKGAIGARLSAADASTFPFPGDIGEIIRYNRVLTAAENASVTSYLRARWGL